MTEFFNNVSNNSIVANCYQMYRLGQIDTYEQMLIMCINELCKSNKQYQDKLLEIYWKNSNLK